MSDPTCPFTPEDLEPQGSRWVLANFHTHTPGSSDYAGELKPHPGLTARDVARGILDECLIANVCVVAITDHNSPSFVRVEGSRGRQAADPERESYYAMMRALAEEQQDKYGGILVLPGVEIGAENIHVLGLFPPSDDPGWEVLKIAAILDEGNCLPEFYGDANASCTEYSVADAIDVIHKRGGIAIPAHIDGSSGFLKEEDQQRLLKLIVARPHLFAVEYLKDSARVELEKLLEKKRLQEIFVERKGHAIAWTQSADAHFIRRFDPDQGGNGVAIGTRERRTWLRLDPGELTFEAVRAALQDPQDRVRVDETALPRGRQGAYRRLPADRTYLRALRLDWGSHRKEVLGFSSGTNVLVGPRGSGKTARAQAFSVIGAATPDLSVADPGSGGVMAGSSPWVLKSADMVLGRGPGAALDVLWWLHRDSPERIYVARVEPQDGDLRIAQGATGQWVDLCPDGAFSRRALGNHFQDLPAPEAQLAPTVPQALSLKVMQELLADPVRLARFIEWHYVPAELASSLGEAHKELRDLSLNPAAMSASELAGRLKELFQQLREPRRRAADALRAFHKDSPVGLSVEWHQGDWTKAAPRRQAAEQLLALQDPTREAAFDVLKAIEDQAEAELTWVSGGSSNAPARGSRMEAAMKGVLLVIGARDLGPVILDAPGVYFEPAELVSTLAPLLLRAVDAGTQFVVAFDDANLPFAVDADLLLVCRRDPTGERPQTLDKKATGGLDRAATAAWALKNLDGGGDQFSRRQERYAGVLGADRAERQKELAKAVLKLAKS